MAIEDPEMKEGSRKCFFLFPKLKSVGSKMLMSEEWETEIPTREKGRKSSGG